MSVGCSYDYGKIEIANFIHDQIPLGSWILDVGAGGGTYQRYLGCSYNFEAVELWDESVELLKKTYSRVYQVDIREFKYPQNYDLIIFGDILEHLSVEDAQKVLAEAEKHARHILIGVPYRLPQEDIYGNECERHLQPDLTHPIFKQRYPGYALIIGRFDLYGYYYK